MKRLAIVTGIYIPERTDMTPTEAAHLILRAAGGAVNMYSRSDWPIPILRAVETVMDAARADAFEEAANVCATLAETTYDVTESLYAALRALAQSHREPKP